MAEFNDNNLNHPVEKKNNTFNIIIGVATLLIAILGSTFAYFSATARSKENDVTVKSAYVSISYDGGTEITANDLIPSTLTVALNKFQKPMESIGTIDDDTLTFLNPENSKDAMDKRCVDALGREVCYVYQFSITSNGEDGGKTDINASITVNKNEFKNLSYVLYEVTFAQEGGSDLVDKYGNRIVDSYRLVSRYDANEGSSYPDRDTASDNIDNTNVRFSRFESPVPVYGENEEFLRFDYPVACLFGFSDQYGTVAINDTSRCATYSITNKQKHTYQLMIWLEETGSIQEEQGLTFQGTVAIDVPGNVDTSGYNDGKITGKD